MPDTEIGDKPKIAAGSNMDYLVSSMADHADFERWMRGLLAGIKSVRRWKNKNIFSNYGFLGNKFNWFYAYILMPFFNFFAELFNRLVRFVDPWRATRENVLEHSWKQMMIIQKIAAIEIYRGNPHRLDFYKLLQWALNHDVQESDSRVGDVNYHDKAKNKEYLDLQERKAFFEIISSGVQEKYSIYFVFPPGSDCPDNSDEAELWNLSEHIGYCYFMLEEICTGKLSYKEKVKFYLDVANRHVPLLQKSADKFVSVKEIVNFELLPKLERAKSCLKK